MSVVLSEEDIDTWLAVKQILADIVDQIAHAQATDPLGSLVEAMDVLERLSLEHLLSDDDEYE